MGHAIDQIILAGRRGVGYAEKVASDIKPELFARKPRFRDGGKETVIDCNHPAFVFGHLALYPARMLGFLNIDAASVATPGHWPDLFKAGVDCKDDPEGLIYPNKDEIMAAFLKGYSTLFDTLAKVDDSVLSQPHPDENIRTKFFPTIGAALVFMCTSHVAMHAGQISTWRRCYGMPSAM
jgi:hypothetical protein